MQLKFFRAKTGPENAVGMSGAEVDASFRLTTLTMQLSLGLAPADSTTLIFVLVVIDTVDTTNLLRLRQSSLSLVAHFCPLMFVYEETSGSGVAGGDLVHRLDFSATSSVLHITDRHGGSA